MAKIGFISLGCAKNQVDCERMMYRVQDAGLEVQPDVIGADVVVINTCGFIDSAKAEAIDYILQMAQLKEQGLIGKILVTGCLTGCQGGIHVCILVGLCDRKANDLCVRICRMYCICGQVGKQRIFQRIGTGLRFILCMLMLPAVTAVRLVPDLIVFNFATVVLNNGGDIPHPSVPLLLCGDGRTSHGTKIHGCKFTVYRIAIAQADPGLHTSAQDIIHNIIQPSEIIYALNLFGSGPAGLDTNPFNANGSNLIVSLFGVKDSTVQLFKSNAQS